MQTEMADGEDQAHEISEQNERSSLLAARLEVCAIFWHKIWLCSACALKFESDGRLFIGRNFKRA